MAKVKKEIVQMWPELKEGEIYALYTTDKSKQFQFGSYVAKFDIPAVFTDTDTSKLPIDLEFILENKDLILKVEKLEYVAGLTPHVDEQTRKEGIMYIGDRKFKMTIRGIMLEKNKPNYELTTDEIDFATKDPRIVRILRK